MKPALIKIFLVDDQENLLKGLRMRLALEDDLEVVGEAKDAFAALRLIPEAQPDVVVMDIQMPKMDGFAATKALLEMSPGMVVIMLSLHDDPLLRTRAQEVGAFAYVEKRDGALGLIREIRRGFELKNGQEPG